jgi:hypothetical protein
VPTVEDNAGADLGILRCRKKGQRTPHAEPDRADFGPGDAGLLQQVIDGACQILGGLIYPQAHHQLARLVGRRRFLAVEQIGRKSEKAFRRESIGDVLDMRNQAPPFLNDDDARAIALRPG